MNVKSGKMASFITRTITGLLLVGCITACVLIGRWAVALLFFAAVALCVYEELRGLRTAGHHVAVWTVYAALVLSGCMLFWEPALLLLPLQFLISFLVVLHVMRRQDPDLRDILYTELPILSIVLPGLCLLGLLKTEQTVLYYYFLVATLLIPAMGDVFAYLTGSLIGGPKLCPHISPNKTIAGAVGGMLGSILAGWLTGVLFTAFSSEAAVLPPWWVNLLLGLTAGFAGQVGDLFASLVKRHCGLKDFGTIFPGHGGMLDRADSVLFAGVVIFAFRCFFLSVL